MGAAAIPIAIGATVAGGVIEGQSHRAAGKFNQRIAEMNAKFAEMEAVDSLERGEINEGIHRQKIKSFKGKQRAAFGASGVDVNQGSPVDVLEATAGIGELDALTIRSNSEREALRFRQKAQSLRLQGKEARRRGRAAATASFLGTAGKLIGFGK